MCPSPCRSAALALVVLALAAAPAAAGELPRGEGTLWLARGGSEPVAVPAVTTRIEVAVAGLGAEVAVSQRFSNPLPEPVEAVYVFPLPEGAAVTEVRIGDARSEIRRRDEAGAVLDRARDAGLAAALLEQERDDLFTLTVASVPAGGTVDVDLSFDVPVRVADGARELVLPATVGPRFVPGTPDGSPATGTGTAPDTDRVPDASRITPALRPPSRRAERSLSVRVALDAGERLGAVESPSHAIAVERAASGTRAVVTLARGAAVPNRDFVLRYRLADGAPRALAMAHHGARGGFVGLVLDVPAAEGAAPDFDLIVALDDSRSLSGAARARALAAVAALFEGAGASIQIVSLTTGERSTPAPVASTDETRAAALAFARGRRPGAGSDLVAALQALLRERGPRRRVVCVVTDGLVGNEREILAAVAGADPDTRVTALGVGAAPGRYLLERVAELGGGVAVYLGPGDEPEAVGARLAARLAAPALTDLEIDWGGLAVEDVAPWPLPELVAGQPVRVFARTREREAATVVVRGSRGGEGVTLRAPVDLRPGADDAGELVARLWARERVRALSLEHAATGDPDRPARIAELGLRFGLVTPYTSLVAVGGQSAPAGSSPRVIAVPVELPAGGSRDAFAADSLDDGAVIESESVPGRATSIEIQARYAGVDRWRLGAGLDVGAAFAGEPALAAGAHLRLDRGVLARLALGGELRALAAPTGDWAAALTLSATSYHLGAVHLGANVGAALTDDGAALALGARAELDLPWPRLDLILRADRFARRGGDRSALTLGVELSF